MLFSKTPPALILMIRYDEVDPYAVPSPASANPLKYSGQPDRRFRLEDGLA